MQIGTGFLFEAEKQIFIDILYQYEGVIAFDDSEKRLLKPAIEPPVVIYTVPHIPWQQQNIRQCSQFQITGYKTRYSYSYHSS